MKYFLGLDNGGTTTKAALYDVRGNEWVSSMDNAASSPNPARRTEDEEMWRANCSVIRDVIRSPAYPRRHCRSRHLWARKRAVPVGKDDGRWATDHFYGQPRLRLSGEVEGRRNGRKAFSCRANTSCPATGFAVGLASRQRAGFIDKIQWISSARITSVSG